ncbi:beta-ketoacyl synthase N-terminal-like domain-containing protein [Buchnera aphidicola (Taiwanaphis decaspermi)]|uniref:beta-ketoacyl synthase N-terminal-like domain-containing protein n=1 Tax=Buchnera aphidicola TaxID=9 RepID=UPI0031B80B64
MRRVVITGIGILSSIGNNKIEVLKSLINSNSGIVFYPSFMKKGMKSQVCGNIKIDNKIKIPNKIKRFMSKSAFYAYISMRQAILDSGLDKSMYSKNERVGIIVSSSSGSPHFYYKGIKNFNKKNKKKISPYILTKAMSSNISACLSTFFNIYGISYSISSACSTSANCIGHSFEQIKNNKQDILFAGGGEEISWELASQFDSMNSLSRNYNNYPHISSRSYDTKRDGFVISGGSGIIVLEELNHAIERKAKIYAELVSYSSNSDGYHMVIPSFKGIARCIKNAIKKVKIPIDYINTHAASTKLGDIVELKAIKKVFKKKIPYISSTKSITGHSLGVSGVHELIYSILMLNNNFISPSINIKNIDLFAKKMNIVTKIKKKKINTILSNSLGFGGSNVALIIKKYIS